MCARQGPAGCSCVPEGTRKDEEGLPVTASTPSLANPARPPGEERDAAPSLIASGMAFYIPIVRTAINDPWYEYTYSHTGRLEFNRLTGDSRLVRLADGEDAGTKSQFSRAARKLWTHWEAGALPEQTAWAS